MRACWASGPAGRTRWRRQRRWRGTRTWTPARLPSARWLWRRRFAFTRTTRCPWKNCEKRRALMSITLPETVAPLTDTLTPRQIVLELDKYVIGQKAAKRAVAIALRNRMRRQKLAPELAEDVVPKNILMIG